jgi:hypothetical protein
MRADTPHFREATRRLILENEIYLVSRSDLNDPFDMRPILDCDWTIKGMRQHIRNIYSNPLLAAASVNLVEFSKIPETALRKTASLKQIRNFKDKFYEYMNELLDKVGICCFTEGLQNPLFWAHYAGSYKGICFELRAASDISHPFRNCMKVNYTDQRPTILASQIGALATVYDTPDWQYISQYAFCTKSTDWSVENEWRFWMPGRARTYQQLPLRTLKSIFLGPLAEEDTSRFICELVRQSNLETKVFATSLSSDNFRVEIARRMI